MKPRFKFFKKYINEISIDLQSIPVSVTERKLRVRWSPELAQDISVFHDIDAEAKLIKILSEEINRELSNSLNNQLTNS